MGVGGGIKKKSEYHLLLNGVLRLKHMKKAKKKKPASKQSGPSCSKLTMSLANDSLKFTSSDTQIC